MGVVVGVVLLLKGGLWHEVSGKWQRNRCGGRVVVCGGWRARDGGMVLYVPRQRMCCHAPQ